MARLNVFLLGPMRVESAGGAEIRFDTSKIQALLAYLVMNREVEHSRETLAGIFWPDSPQSDAMQSLRQALSRLQRSLGDESEFMDVSRKTVRVEPAGELWLDTAEFDAAQNRCARHPHRRLDACLNCLEELQRAVSLYRGDLLAGFPLSDSWAFNEWLSVKREHYQRQVVEALTHLTATSLKRNEYEAAHGFAWKQVSLQPWNEEAHRQLMEALALGGQRSAALMQFQVCKRTLVQELSVAPDDRTIELYERIRDHSSEGGAADLSHLQPHRVRVPLTPLIGRLAEHQHLLEFLALRDSRMLTVTGMGGSGKTHLVLQVAWDAAGTFVDGIFFVPLPAVNGTEKALEAICQALECPLDGRRAAENQLRAWLHNREVLLVLDSLERAPLLGPCLAELLAFAPQLKILATSRVRLNIRGEQVIELHGLDYPPEETSRPGSRPELVTYQAVKLFVAGARRIEPAFSLSDLTPAEQAAVGKICTLVAGNPLAITLAAAWVRALPPSAILDEIQHNLGILTAFWQDTPERHHSVQSLLDETWTALEPLARVALRRLSVFQGDFDHADAASVGEASPLVLRTLTEQQLVEKKSARLYHIHPLVRHYAARWLQKSDDERLARQRHSSLILRHVADRDQVPLCWADIEQAWQWAAQEHQFPELEASLRPLRRFIEQQQLFHPGTRLLGSTARLLQTSRTGPDLEFACRLLVEQAGLHNSARQAALAAEAAQQMLALVRECDSTCQACESLQAAAAAELDRAHQSQDHRTPA